MVFRGKVWGLGGEKVGHCCTKIDHPSPLCAFGQSGEVEPEQRDLENYFDLHEPILARMQTWFIARIHIIQFLQINFRLLIIT